MTQTANSTANLIHARPQGAAEVQASRLRWLMRLRWLYVVGAALLAAAVSLWVHQGVAIYLLGGAAAVLLASNLVFGRLVGQALRLESDGAQKRLTLLADLQIALDLLVLACLMHITGGAYNVLLAVMVFHLAVTASLQPKRRAYVHAALAAVLFVALIAMEFWAIRWQIGIESPILPGLLGYPPLPVAAVGWLTMAQSAAIVVTVACFFGVVHFTHAILERLRGINRRLSEANRELSGLDLAKSRFLRVSSHQLRGPLAAVHTLLTATQELGGLSDKQLALMGKIRLRCDEMMTQVDELMTLSTIKERASETQPTLLVDVCEAMGNTVAAFDEEARQRGLTLTCACGGKARVLAWEDGIETVLEQLLSNALHYTPKGGTVSVLTVPKEASVEVEVADTGIGIPQEQQDRLFSEFFRATNARQVCGGTGLGLSIVKATVERLGGQISIASKPGEGTRVKFCLPLAKDVENRDSGLGIRDSGSSPETRNANPETREGTGIPR